MSLLYIQASSVSLSSVSYSQPVFSDERCGHDGPLVVVSMNRVQNFFSII